ncbi:hypothetical protein ACHAXR_005986 [Thalassiosira sp. AJA248-18]
MMMAPFKFFVCVFCAFLPSCHAFAPAASTRSTHAQHRQTHHRHRRRRISLSLHAVTKRQTFILDGAELSYYIKSLSQTTNAPSDGGAAAGTATELPNVAPRSPKKRNRVGAMTFVTATLDKDINHRNGTLWLEEGAHIIGVEVSSSIGNSTTASGGDNDDSREIISIDGDLRLYQDSIAVLPSKLSPDDAISTASTSLLGVHCSSLPSLLENDRKGKVVIVGGGEYALFLAKALVGLGNQVSLVSARPSWSLPSPTEVASSKNKDLVEVLPPAVGKMSLGFATAIGEFDTLVDTLGDEMGMGSARTLVGNDFMHGGRFLEQLKELHGCNNYLSTLTRSQQYVLKKGLLFARDPVVRYQRERDLVLLCNNYWDQNIIQASGQNENGSHKSKANFVRGWSLSDLTELKTLPMEGAGRFGFPVVDLSVTSVALRKRALADSLNNKEKASSSDDANKVEEESTKQKSLLNESSNNAHAVDYSNNTDIMITTPKSTANNTIKITKRPSKPTTSSNPYVTTIQSASELNQKVIESKRNCILFLTASYCQKCKRMSPQFNRIARKTTESTSDVLFAHVDISNGPRGKQLGKVLKAEKVPSVIVFQKGDTVQVEGDEASTVIERNNLNRLEKVATMLGSGERIVNINALLSSETVKK